jgi:PAS domain S-box-containing protein
VGGLIAGSMTGAYRLWMGGSGVVPGLIGIGISVAIAVFLHLRNRKNHITFSDIVDLAFVGAGSSIIVILVVSALRHGSAFEQVAAPGVTLIFGSLLLSGAAILQERRRQETATTNAIYGAIMDALPDCLNVKDSEGRFLAANPATAALMGAADKYALIGRKDGDFYDAETAEKFREEQKRVVRWGNPETIEQKFRSTNGTMTWLTTLMVPFPSKDGREIGIITHNRDITQQKQIELDLAETQARLSDALTHMADGLVMFDGNGQLVYASDRFRKMFSIPDSAMLTGASLRTVLGEAMDHFGFVLPEGMSKQDWIEEELLKVARMESTEFQLRDGRWFQNRHGSVRDGAWLTVFSDINER